jgi:hypothetical protein
MGSSVDEGIVAFPLGMPHAVETTPSVGADGISQ